MGASTSGVVAVVAAAHARRIRETMDAFRLADATAPERARPLAEIGARHQHEIDTLARDGILVQEPGAGGWWLSERAYITHRDRQPKRAVKAVLAVVIVLLLVVMVTLFATARRTAHETPSPSAPAAAR